MTSFKANDFVDDGKYHLLLAASGSVATIKIPNIIRALSSRKDISIILLLTEAAANFLQGQSDEQPHLDEIAKYANVQAIFRDADEWKSPWTRGAAILHIELRRWADALFIVPLSANTLAKLAYGLSDNLLTSVVRAWQVEPLQKQFQSTDDGSPTSVAPQKKIHIAPAMNTAMWIHPATEEHLGKILGYTSPNSSVPWIQVLRPQEKELACGDTGTGAMCDWTNVVLEIEDCIKTRRDHDSASPQVAG